MSAVATLTPEQLDSLGEEIATFATRIDVAEHALLTRLRIFDAHEAWGNHNARSCAEWLSWWTNLSIKAAREKVRVARALGSLPEIDALFGRGVLSYFEGSGTHAGGHGGNRAVLDRRRAECLGLADREAGPGLPAGHGRRILA